MVPRGVVMLPGAPSARVTREATVLKPSAPVAPPVMVKRVPNAGLPRSWTFSAKMICCLIGNRAAGVFFFAAEAMATRVFAVATVGFVLGGLSG